MEENQALLDEEAPRAKSCHKSYAYHHDNIRGSSSDESDSWWADSHSSCNSSCSELDSASSAEWEKEVNVKGELFYIKSDPFTETPEILTVVETESNSTNVNGEKTSSKKSDNPKKGKIGRWMRRRESKRLRSKPLIASNKETLSMEKTTSSIKFSNPGLEEIQVSVKVDTIGQGVNLCEKMLGFTTTYLGERQHFVITGIIAGGPSHKTEEIFVGDYLIGINNEIVTPQNIEKILGDIPLPNEINLKIRRGCNSVNQRRTHSSLVQNLLEKNTALEEVLENQPLGICFISMENQSVNKNDVIYSYPFENSLTSCRGTFLTLYHLLSDITIMNNCLSSRVTIKNQPSHVIYVAEDNYLLLVAIPETRCTVREATLIIEDLVRCLLFSYQSLQNCFTSIGTSNLDHFFSLFFSRLLTTGFSSDAPHNTILENIPSSASESAVPQFEDILPSAAWLPLPREAQLQIDDTLNELESNDFEFEGEECIANRRSFTIIGSCLYHKGYLLASHLTKEDLLDIHSFCRQNSLIQLFRKESVKTLVIWREVYPQSVNRGLPTKKPSVYSIPKGRWFLLIVGQGFDALAVMLESGGCSAKAEGNISPPFAFVEEAEDTLRHIKRLGISNLASHWSVDNIQSKIVTPEEIISKKGNKKKDNLLGFVKSFDGTPRLQGSGLSPSSLGKPSSELISGLRGKGISHGETSEDSMSQAASNISEVSDENAPILGRRAERRKSFTERTSEESENSDSDWEFFRESNRQELLNSRKFSISPFRGLSYEDVNQLVPSKVATGLENILFHYVHLDGSEGLLMSPTLDVKEMSAKTKELIGNFRRNAQIIQSLLENNVRFKKSSQENSKCLIDKSLVAVKEHGILSECYVSESDSSKKSSICYWVVGRLFFTPQPREVYVSYHDDIPQNLVEIAFRLGLQTAG